MLVKTEYIQLGELLLSSEKVINNLVLAYEIYGELNEAKDNAILLSHTLTGNQHAAGVYREDDNDVGWWDQAIGPGKDIDTERYCVICINNISGSHGSSSPASTNPVTNRRYGLDFPVVTIADMVNAEKKLMEYLQIPQWHCLIGGCMGGFKVLQWLTSYPELCKHAIIIATSQKVSAHTIGFWYVMRKCIMSDPAWNEGKYYDNPTNTKGIQFANMVGSMIWLSNEFLEAKYSNKRSKITNQLLQPEFEIEYFLENVLNKENHSIDPNSLLYMMKAMTTFDIADDTNWPENLKKLQGKVLFISNQQDWRYPPTETDALVNTFQSQKVNVEKYTIESSVGHGAFIHDYASISAILAKFLAKN